MTVVNRIRIHPDGSGPGMAMIGGRRDKDIDVAVPVIAPGNVEFSTLLASAWIDANLGEAIGARDAGDPEISRSCGDYAAIVFELSATVMRNRHHDAIAIVPDEIGRAHV